MTFAEGYFEAGLHTSKLTSLIYCKVDRYRIRLPICLSLFRYRAHFADFSEVVRGATYHRAEGTRDDVGDLLMSAGTRIARLVVPRTQSILLRLENWISRPQLRLSYPADLRHRLAKCILKEG